MFDVMLKVTADSKGRVPLGKTHASNEYIRKELDDGTIILEPAVTIPANEAWVWKNKKALDSMTRALKQAQAGEFVSSPTHDKVKEDSAWLESIDEDDL